jgi:hypothetical protein
MIRDIVLAMALAHPDLGKRHTLEIQPMFWGHRPCAISAWRIAM